MSKLGDYLKELRGTLSYGDVQKGTRISSGLIHRYEHGDRVPTPATLRKLAEFYEVSYADLRLKFYEDMFSDAEEREIARQFFAESKE